MGRFGERPLHVNRFGLAGSSEVRFQATIRHGKSTRQINVDVSAREILAIADAIRATANQACTAPHRRTKYPPDDLSVGHAIWHLDNPEHPMPCITGDVIDVESNVESNVGGDVGGDVNYVKNTSRAAQDLVLRSAARFGDATARAVLDRVEFAPRAPENRLQQEAIGAEICLVVVGYVSGREPFRLLSRISADTGLAAMPDPPLTDAEMQPVAFAAKMALARALSGRRRRASAGKPTTRRRP